MDLEQATEEKAGFLARSWDWLKRLPGRCKNKFFEVANSTKKLAQDDPRRVIHSLKVGLALTLVSLFYCEGPLYNGFETSGVWVGTTVVFVLEFTAGATLGKVLHRSFGTFFGGALAVGAQQLARLSGQKGEPFVLGILLFSLLAASAYARVIPWIKASYDYGLLCVILTLGLVTVLAYRAEDAFEVAQKRLFMVLIGVGTCGIMSLFICPIWAGEDLHNSIASNIEKLANYLEGFGGEYFQDAENEGGVVVTSSGKALLQGYKSVLNSKGKEESWANLARWELGHGRFRLRHPWKQYLKIGALARQCAYRIEALDGYINSNVQAPLELRNKIREPSMRMCSEAGKLLKTLASEIKTMTKNSIAKSYVEHSKAAINDLHLALKAASLEELDVLAVAAIASVASILIQITRRVEKISEAVEELSQLAHFESVEPRIIPETFTGSGKPVLDCDSHTVKITTHATKNACDNEVSEAA